MFDNVVSSLPCSSTATIPDIVDLRPADGMPFNIPIAAAVWEREKREK